MAEPFFPESDFFLGQRILVEGRHVDSGEVTGSNPVVRQAGGDYMTFSGDFSGFFRLRRSAPSQRGLAPITHANWTVFARGEGSVELVQGWRASSSDPVELSDSSITLDLSGGDEWEEFTFEAHPDALIWENHEGHFGLDVRVDGTAVDLDYFYLQIQGEDGYHEPTGEGRWSEWHEEVTFFREDREAGVGVSLSVQSYTGTSQSGWLRSFDIPPFDFSMVDDYMDGRMAELVGVTDYFINDATPIPPYTSGRTDFHWHESDTSDNAFAYDRNVTLSRQEVTLNEVHFPEIPENFPFAEEDEGISFTKVPEEDRRPRHGEFVQYQNGTPSFLGWVFSRERVLGLGREIINAQDEPNGDFHPVTSYPPDVLTWRIFPGWENGQPFPGPEDGIEVFSFTVHEFSGSPLDHYDNELWYDGDASVPSGYVSTDTSVWNGVYGRYAYFMAYNGFAADLDSGQWRYWEPEFVRVEDEFVDDPPEGLESPDVRRDARTRVNGVIRDVISVDVSREIATVLPDQVAGGGGIMAGSATLEIAEGPEVVKRRRGPWDRSGGWPPAPHETLEVDVTVNGRTERVFTGRISSVSGNPNGPISVEVRDDSKWLNVSAGHQALLPNMPPVGDGAQRSVGLRAEYIVDWIMRQGGFFTTPPRETGSRLSVPAQGTLWPEHQSIDDTAGVVSAQPYAGDSGPDWHASPWGWAWSNAVIEWEPTSPYQSGSNVQLVAMAAPDHSGLARFEMSNGARLDIRANRSIAVGVESSAETWTPPNGWRVIELGINGSTWTLRTDNGGMTSFSVGSVTGDVSSLTVEAHPDARLGSVQLTHPTGDTFEAVEHEPNATMQVDPSMFGDLTAAPSIEEDGRSLLSTISEAMVASAWVDEYGHMHWVHPAVLRNQNPELVLTSTADLIDIAWVNADDASRSSVVMRGNRPNIIDTGGQNVSQTTLESDALFPQGEWELNQAGRNAVDSLVSDIPVSDPEILVEGHTDNVPPADWQEFDSNQELSVWRAESVRDQILTTMPNANVEVEGYGSSRPVASNDTSSGRAQNRRVEISYSGWNEEAAKHREFAVTVWSGSGDTTNSGDETETIISSGGDDWIMLSQPQPINPNADVRRFNMGLGSWHGAMIANTSSGGESWPSSSPVSTSLSRVGPDAWKVASTTRSMGVGRVAIQRAPDAEELAPSRRGENLPVIRAKARVEWEDSSNRVQAGASHFPELSHNSGVWVQGDSLGRLGSWIAEQVTDPPPIIQDLPIVYNHDVKLGQVIDVAEDAIYGVRLRCLVTGLNQSVSDGDAEMTLTARVVRVISTTEGWPDSGDELTPAGAQ